MAGKRLALEQEHQSVLLTKPSFIGGLVSDAAQAHWHSCGCSGKARLVLARWAAANRVNQAAMQL